MKKIKFKLKFSFWDKFLLYGFLFCKSLSIIFSVLVRSVSSGIVGCLSVDGWQFQAKTEQCIA